MADKNYSGTGKPNTSIAGAKGTGKQTGNRTAPTGMPETAGTFADHYAPDAAGGAGKGATTGAPADKEKVPGGKAGKKGKPKKFTSIAELRDAAKKLGSY